MSWRRLLASSAMSLIRTSILSIAALTSAMLLSVSATSKADLFIDYSSIGGNTTTHTWGNPFAVPSGMTEGPTGSPSSWSAGMTSSEGAVFRPVSGNNGFFAGGIYGFMTGANYAIDSALLTSDVNTLILEVVMTDSPTYGNIISPVLYIGGESYTADFTLSYELGTIGGGGFSGEGFSFQYQWNLSALDPFTNYSIDFGQQKHTLLVGLSVTESDAILTSSALAVPEPSTWCLLVFAGAAGAWHSRRRLLRKA